MVEQEAVNFEVASSSLAGGAIFVVQKLKKTDSDLASLGASLAGGAIFFFEIYVQKMNPCLVLRSKKTPI